jgi:hypothetical protein
MGVCISNPDTASKSQDTIIKDSVTNQKQICPEQQPIILVNDTVLPCDNQQSITSKLHLYPQQQIFVLDPMRKSPELSQESIIDSLKTKENSWGKFASSEDFSDDLERKTPDFICCDSN